MMGYRNCWSWRGMLSSLMLAAMLVVPAAVVADTACDLDLPAQATAADISAAVQAVGVRGDQLVCYVNPLLTAGIAPADIAEGLLSAGYHVYDVVRVIVIVGGAEVVVDVVARVNTLLGPTVRQTVRDAVAEAARVRHAGPVTGELVTGDCELELFDPISVEGISIAVKAAGVRDELLDCYVAFLLNAGVAPADMAEGLLLAGYLVFDVVRAIVFIGGADVANDVVVRANTVYCRMLTKGSTGGSTISPTVADAARAGAAAAAAFDDRDWISEFAALVAAGEIMAGAGRLEPEDDSGGMPDSSLR